MTFLKCGKHYLGADSDSFFVAVTISARIVIASMGEYLFCAQNGYAAVGDITISARMVIDAVGDFTISAQMVIARLEIALSWRGW